MDRKHKLLNEANSKLNEECKEYQLSLQEMTTKYNKLLRKSNVSLFYLIWQLRGVAMSDLLFLISCGSMVNGYES